MECDHVSFEVDILELEDPIYELCMICGELVEI